MHAPVPATVSRGSRNRTGVPEPRRVHLHPQERLILQAAVEAGGSCMIDGLPLREMLMTAELGLTLQREGLAHIAILFEDPPDRIMLEITGAGRRALL